MKRWTLLLAGVLLLGAACGDSDDSSLSGAAMERGVKPTPTAAATPTPTPAATPTPTPAPSTGGLSIAAGYNFTPSNREPFGHVLTLKVGGATLTPDISAMDPTNAKRMVVGVIENQTWAGGAKDPLTTTLRISPANAKLLARIDPKAPAAIEFVVFRLDKAWFTSLGTYNASRVKGAGPLSAITNAGDIRISAPQAGGGGIPPNSVLTVVLRPTSTAQAVNGPNTSSTAAKTSTWGGA